MNPEFSTRSLPIVPGPDHLPARQPQLPPAESQPGQPDSSPFLPVPVRDLPLRPAAPGTRIGGEAPRADFSRGLDVAMLVLRRERRLQLGVGQLTTGAVTLREVTARRTHSLELPAGVLHAQAARQLTAAHKATQALTDGHEELPILQETLTGRTETPAPEGGTSAEVIGEVVTDETYAGLPIRPLAVAAEVGPVAWRPDQVEGSSEELSLLEQLAALAGISPAELAAQLPERVSTQPSTGAGDKAAQDDAAIFAANQAARGDMAAKGAVGIHTRSPGEQEELLGRILEGLRNLPNNKTNAA